MAGPHGFINGARPSLVRGPGEYNWAPVDGEHDELCSQNLVGMQSTEARRVLYLNKREKYADPVENWMHYLKANDQIETM